MSIIDDITAYAEALMDPPTLAASLAAELAAQQLYQKALHDRLILWMQDIEARLAAVERLRAVIDADDTSLLRERLRALESPLHSTSTPIHPLLG